MLLTQCICHNNTTTTKTYPPGVTKECIYGFDILNTSEQLDNLSKYQQLTYVKFYTNYTINITRTKGGTLSFNTAIKRTPAAQGGQADRRQR